MKKSNRLISLVRTLLLGFVLVSVGFVIGRESAERKNNIAPAIAEKPAVPVSVRVYYMHGNKRCKTCRKIGELTEKLLREKYAKAIAEGEVEFRELNFQKETELAEKLDVVASGVVVARLEGGEIKKHMVLGKVWKLYNDPVAFNNYISSAISDCLMSDGEKK